MKKIFLILFSTLLMFSCGKLDPKKGSIKTINIEGKTLYVYPIDGHEYLGVISQLNRSFLTHYENCTNPIHNNKVGTIIIKDGSYIQLPDTLNEK